MSAPSQNWVTFEGAAQAPSAPAMLEPSRPVLILPTFGLELQAASRQVSTIGQPQPRAVTVDSDDINHTVIVGFFTSTPKDKLFVRGLDRYNLKFAVRLLDTYGVPAALHLDADTRFPKVVRNLEGVGCFQGFMNSLKRCCMSRRLSSSEFDQALSYLIAKSQLQELTLSVSTHFRLSLVELCAQRGINFIFQEPTELILYDNEVERLPFWPQLSVSAYLTIIGLNKILLQIAHGLRPRPDNWQFNVAVPSNIASKYERKPEPGQKEQDLPPESREEKEARKREMVLETIEIALLNGIWLSYGRHSIMTPNSIYTFRFTHELWIEVRPLNGDRLDIRFTKTPSTFIPNLAPICAGRQ